MIEIKINKDDRLADAAWARLQKQDGYDSGKYWPCFVCGRPVLKEAARWVHVIEGGSHVAEEGDKLGGPGDMDWHPIGPECFRKQPALKKAATDNGA